MYFSKYNAIWKKIHLAIKYRLNLFRLTSRLGSGGTCIVHHFDCLAHHFMWRKARAEWRRHITTAKLLSKIKLSPSGPTSYPRSCHIILPASDIVRPVHPAFIVLSSHQRTYDAHFSRQVRSRWLATISGLLWLYT